VGTGCCGCSIALQETSLSPDSKRYYIIACIRLTEVAFECSKLTEDRIERLPDYPGILKKLKKDSDIMREQVKFEDMFSEGEEDE